MQVKRFPPNTAGGRMITAFPRFAPGKAVGEIKRVLLEKASSFDLVDYIYVVDKNGVLRGVASIKEILSSPENVRIDRLMVKKIATVHPLTPQERVVYVALHHGIKAVPVVDKENRLLGIVPHDTILQIFNQEVREDVFKFGGIFHRVGKEFHTIKSPASIMIKARLPSLLIGLVGGTIAAYIVSGFEAMISKYLMLAAFIPVLVYMSDAVGTQSEALIVRSLALDPKLLVKRYLLRETKVAASLGLIFGVLLGLIALIGWGNSLVAAIILISLFISALAAGLSATLLAILLKKGGFDPAAASGPFATIISDVTTLIIYFLVASTFLSYFGLL